MTIPEKWIDMLNKEWKIMEVFERKPWEMLTFKQVKQFSKNKSDNYVHRTLKKFVRTQVLIEKKYGNSIVYSPSHSNNSIRVLSLVSEYKAAIADLPNKLINSLINEIPTSLFSFIITGSYAENKQTKKSDLDIAVIFDNARNTKEILVPLKNIGELSVPYIHPYVFTEKQFYEMLINDEENYGKEMARKHLIVFGAEAFYKILFKAVEHGFKG